MDMEVICSRVIGREVALFAKTHMPKLISQSEEFLAGKYSEALSKAFLKVDELLQSVEGKKELSEIAARFVKSSYDQDDALNVGCTACVVLITESEIYIANAGDSRCVVSRKGVAVALSKDHKPELEEERKRIEAAGGYIEDGRVNGVLNLSRTLGDLEYKKNKEMGPESQIIVSVPDIVIEKIGDDTEFLIIACDGVWDCYSNEEAVSVFRNKIWDIPTNKPKKTKLSKVISDVFDSIIAVDLGDEGIM